MRQNLLPNLDGLVCMIVVPMNPGLIVNLVWGDYFAAVQTCLPTRIDVKLNKLNSCNEIDLTEKFTLGAILDD